MDQEFGTSTELVVGTPGQFEIQVDGQTVAARGGGLLSRLFGGGWPAAAVVQAVRAKVGSGS
ncbi:MAG: Rdx family protein [Planctomycetes bacterium]|nr:Rdx family protein [Planctomycetota bacterium]